MSFANYPTGGFGAQIDYEIERGMELRGETRDGLEGRMKFGLIHVETSSLVDFWMKRAESWRRLRAICQGDMDP